MWRSVESFYYIDRPLPMTLEDAGDTIAKLTINNTITPCYLRSGIQDINGKLEYIFYTIAGPFGTSGIALKDTSFLTPSHQLKCPLTWSS